MSFTVAIAITAEEEKYTYGAIVVEYHQEDATFASPEEKLEARTKRFIEILKNSNHDSDIILFPEDALMPPGDLENLTGEVPKPFEKILCNSSDEKYKDYLKEFSCAAIENNITIVINSVEKENCTLNNSTGFCPESGIIFYNTDIAFNEKGFVSGKYHKWNLYGEIPLSPPAVPEVVTIKTKRNDTFGIFTCFDLLFSVPALNLTRDLSVKNILFPTFWFSELPYLTALQAQQMWAQENNVNFLSAGVNFPMGGSGGTGIFVGEKDRLATEIVGGNGTGPTRTIVKRVPRLDIPNNPYLNFTEVEQDVDELAKDMDIFKIKTDSSMKDHTAVVLDRSESVIVEEVCNGETIKTCCLFNMTIEVNKTIQGQNSYVYQMAVFNGVRSYDGFANAGIESCALLACLDESIASCGKRFKNYSDIFWPITFKTLSVSSSFPKDVNRIQFPTSLLASIRPISPQNTTWMNEENGEYLKRTHSLKEPQNRLLTFGIYGRDFSRDIPTVNTANINISVYFIIATGFIVIFQL
ncbi:hypothetical protein JTB14_024961 [Gonioctena quinquepunctata]|nr:hypothetical protein JTB14_024961 [Gonioctena quinquepunctata]